LIYLALTFCHAGYGNIWHKEVASEGTRSQTCKRDPQTVDKGIGAVRQAYHVLLAGGLMINQTNVKATRKDVLAKCYGSDITRKKKLLENKRRVRSVSR
jgi:translation elongation factor EF-4